eukprot:5927570-Amphidinium_carterae.1
MRNCQVDWSFRWLDRRTLASARAQPATGIVRSALQLCPRPKDIQSAECERRISSARVHTLEPV